MPSINVPAHDNSAMDGYAVRFSDLKPGETALTEIGTALAGRAFRGKVGAGECVRVMTGAVMPAGTDTVVIQEVVQEGRQTRRHSAGTEEARRTCATPAKT